MCLSEVHKAMYLGRCKEKKVRRLNQSTLKQAQVKHREGSLIDEEGMVSMLTGCIETARRDLS
jgi:hypothetical protein